MAPTASLRCLMALAVLAVLGVVTASAGEELRPAHQWYPVFRSIGGTYNTTHGARGEVCSSSGFAKLSDEDINNISDGSGVHLFLFTSLSSARNTMVYVRTEFDYNDTEYGFGWWKHEFCKSVSRVEDCVWMPVLEWVPLTTGYFKGITVEAISKVGCEGWSIDTQISCPCYKGAGCSTRCYKAGRACAGGGRRDVVVYKYGASNRPASMAYSVGMRCADAGPLWSGPQANCQEACAGLSACNFFTTYANGTCALSATCASEAEEPEEAVARTYRVVERQSTIPTTTTAPACAAPPCDATTNPPVNRMGEDEPKEPTTAETATKVIAATLGGAVLMGCVIGFFLNRKKDKGGGVGATPSSPYQEEPDFTWTATGRSMWRSPWYSAPAPSREQAHHAAQELRPPPGPYAAPGQHAMQGQHAAHGYAPQGQYATQGGQHAPQGQYAPQSHYAPQQQYAAPGQYAASGQYAAQGQHAAQGHYGAQGQYAAQGQHVAWGQDGAHGPYPPETQGAHASAPAAAAGETRAAAAAHGATPGSTPPPRRHAPHRSSRGTSGSAEHRRHRRPQHSAASSASKAHDSRRRRSEANETE